VLLNVVESPLLCGMLAPLLRVKMEGTEIDRVDAQVGLEVLAATAIVDVIGAVLPVVIAFITATLSSMTSSQRS